MKSGLKLVLGLGFVFEMLCGSTLLTAQGTQSSASGLQGRCVRWLQSIQPDQKALNATDFCRGIQADEAATHYSLKCNHDIPIPFSRSPARWPSHCNFAGEVTPTHTLAVDFRSGSRGPFEFPSAYPASAETLANFGADAQYTGATFYSRTDFLVGSDRLPAGLYKLFAHREDDGWVLDFAQQSGEWDTLLPVEHPAWHVQMNSIRGTDPTKNPVARILDPTQRCAAAASGAGTVREMELSFGLQDVSVCVTLLPEAAPATEALSAH